MNSDRHIIIIFIVIASVLLSIAAIAGETASAQSVYAAYVKTLKTATDLSDLDRFVSKQGISERLSMSPQEQDETLEMAKALHGQIKCTSATGEIGDTEGTIILKGHDRYDETSTIVLTVHMVNEPSGWKVEKESFSFSDTSP